LHVTVYPVIGEPPLLAGAAKVIAPLPLPDVADTAVGTPGKPPGVTLFDAAEGGPTPATLVAVTVNV
jgi:hypothetical protein